MGGGSLFSCLAQALWALFSRSVAPWHFQNTLGMSVDFTFCPHCHLPEGGILSSLSVLPNPQIYLLVMENSPQPPHLGSSFSLPLHVLPPGHPLASQDPMGSLKCPAWDTDRGAFGVSRLASPRDTLGNLPRMKQGP